MVKGCPKPAETPVISDPSYGSIGYSIAVGRVQNNALIWTANSIEQLGKVQKRGFRGCAGIRSQSCTARAVQTARSPDAENTLESAFSIVRQADGASIAHARPPLPLVVLARRRIFVKMRYRTKKSIFSKDENRLQH